MVQHDKCLNEKKLNKTKGAIFSINERTNNISLNSKCKSKWTDSLIFKNCFC